MLYNTGILRDKTMAQKLMYIPNDDTQNYPFYKLQFVFEAFQTFTLMNQLIYLERENLILSNRKGSF